MAAVDGHSDTGPLDGVHRWGLLELSDAFLQTALDRVDVRQPVLLRIGAVRTMRL